MSKSKLSTPIVGLAHNCGSTCEGKNCVYCKLNWFHSDHERRLEGKILTAIDASIVDPRQNKALKDIVSTFLHEVLWEASVDTEKIVHAYLTGKEYGPSLEVPEGLSK